LAPLTLALRLTQALPGTPAHMVESRAILLGAGSFVVCLALCIALFLALDVSLIFLVGPAVAIGYSSFLAYKSARDDVR
jgi:hypothetical protein